MRVWNDKTFMGRGFELSDKKNEKLVDIFYNEENRTGHLLVLGTTRVGKTRLIENMVEQDIARGYSTVIIDPKGDWELFARVFHSARRAGREKEILFISPFYAHLSNKINPNSTYYLDDELINHVMSGIPVSGDPFFYNVAYEVASAIIRGKLLIRKSLPRNMQKKLTFREIGHSASYEGLKEIRRSLEEIYDTALEAEKIDITKAIDSILEAPQDNFSKVTKTLQTTLMQLTQGNTGRIIGSETQNTFIDRLENNKGVILYVQTGSLLTKQVSYTLARVIVSMIQSLAGRLYVADKKLSKPLSVYMDEFSNVVYMGIEDLFNKAGGANIFLHGFTQNFADIVAEVGQDRADKIAGNTNTKLFMRVTESKSSRLITERAGVGTDYSAVLGLKGVLNAREVDFDIVKENEGLNLKKREYFYFGFEGNFKGKTPPTEPINIKFKLPNIETA